MLQRPVHDAGNKRPVPLLEILVFIQYVPQDDMAELAVLRDLQEHFQNDLPLIYRLRHLRFLPPMITRRRSCRIMDAALAT